MIPIAPDLLSLLRLPLALLAFLVPGWLLVRALGSPAPLLTAVAASSALLLNLVLLLDAVGAPVHAGSTGLALGLITAGLAVWVYRRRRGAPAPAHTPVRWPTGWERLWLVPPALALLSVSLRATLDPLSGYDNGTRWDYLARLLLSLESLAPYPPVTTDDFRLYGWCDGIPPLVPVLNFWIYAVCGSVAPALTAARVVGEAVLAGVLIHRLADRLWGAGAGWAGLAAAASSSLLLWAVAMGQETGLTTVTFAGLVLLLVEHRADPRPTTALWAGVVAGVGALSREYGLAFILFGGAVLLFRRSGRASLGAYIVAAALVTGPWYLRNWIITGNPVFPHSLGGLFPTNPVHTEVMRSIAHFWGLGSGYFNPRNIPVALAVLAGPLLLVAGVGAVRAGRAGWLPVAGILLVAGLWLWSIPSTAAGWIYADRVLAPALALAAALAGWLARAPRALRAAALLALTLVTLDAARRTWLLPSHPSEPVWPYTLAPWQEARDEIIQIRASPVWPVLIHAAAGRIIVVDHPAHHVEITLRRGRAGPWFSPVVRPMFEPDLDFAEACARLRAGGVRFVTMMTGNPMSDWLCRRHPFLQELTQAHVPTARVHSLVIYDLDLLVPASPADPAPR